MTNHTDMNAATTTVDTDLAIMADMCETKTLDISLEFR